VHSMHLLNALLAKLYKTPQRFCLLLCHVPLCTLCTYSMPSWQSSTELLRDYVFYCVLFHIVLPSRYSTTLRSSPESMTLAIVPPWRILVQIPQNWKCSLALAIRTYNVLSHPPSINPQRSTNLKSSKSCKCIPIHTSISYKEHTKTFTQHRQYAGKTALVCINVKCLLYKVFLSSCFDRVLAPSSSTSSSHSFYLFFFFLLLSPLRYP
jgi:hypothetical protein